MKDGWVVLGLMKGLTEVFEGIWRMVEQFWDKWKAWSTFLKGLDGRPSCFGTYQRLGRRVWRDWMRGRAILRLMEGLADEFEGVGWEPDVFWDLWRAWPSCLKGLDGRPTCYGRSNCYETYERLGRRVMGDQTVMRLMKGLADVFEGLDGRPTCYGTYEGLG